MTPPLFKFFTQLGVARQPSHRPFGISPHRWYRKIPAPVAAVNPYFLLSRFPAQVLLNMNVIGTQKNQTFSTKIGRTGFPFQNFQINGSLHLFQQIWCQRRRNHRHPRSGFQETTHTAFTDRSSTYDQARDAFQFQKNRICRWGNQGIKACAATCANFMNGLA